MVVCLIGNSVSGPKRRTNKQKHRKKMRFQESIYILFKGVVKGILPTDHIVVLIKVLFYDIEITSAWDLVAMVRFQIATT